MELIKRISLAISFFTTLSLISFNLWAQVDLEKLVDSSDMAPKVKKYVKDRLIKESHNNIFASAIETQNEKKLSLAEIQKMDQEWVAAEEPTPLQNRMMNNNVAKEIKRIIAKNSAIVEAFVMDDQGANVGQNNLTSDYWQGDEDKWKKSYNDGKGGINVGTIKFDKSANAQIQIVSIPVMDGQNKVIGAVAFGLNVAAIK